MIRAAGKHKFEPALSSNPLHHTERTIHFLQHGPLLDVKFKITQFIARHSSGGNFSRVEPVILNRLPDGRPFCIRAAQQFRIEAADQRSAADERRAESHALFLRKPQKLDRKRQTLARQRLEQRNAQDHA